MRVWAAQAADLFVPSRAAVPFVACSAPLRTARQHGATGLVASPIGALLHEVGVGW